MPVTSTHLQAGGYRVAAVAAAAPVANADSPQQVFGRFVDLLYRRRQVRAAFDVCVARSGFVDHVQGGRCSRAMAVSRLTTRLGADGGRIDVLHAVCDGDVGMVHLVVHGRGDALPAHRVEIYRLADGRITEHWTVAGAPA